MNSEVRNVPYVVKRRFPVVKKFDTGCYVILTGEDRDIWVRSKMRKASTCSATDTPLAKGEEHYRPLTNRNHRGWRLLRAYVEDQT